MWPVNIYKIRMEIFICSCMIFHSKPKCRRHFPQRERLKFVGVVISGSRMYLNENFRLIYFIFMAQKEDGRIEIQRNHFQCTGERTLAQRAWTREEKYATKRKSKDRKNGVYIKQYEVPGESWCTKQKHFLVGLRTNKTSKFFLQVFIGVFAFKSCIGVVYICAICEWAFFDCFTINCQAKKSSLNQYYLFDDQKLKSGNNHINYVVRKKMNKSQARNLYFFGSIGIWRSSFLVYLPSFHLYSSFHSHFSVCLPLPLLWICGLFNFFWAH